MKKIVSVQDLSCYGQCSLTVALPVLSARGIETAILPSGILSNHTGGFGGFTFLDLTEEMIRIVEQWKREGITFDAIYTGYIGDARQFDIIRDLRGLLNPGGKLYVDPAMADHGRLYSALNQDIVEGMRGIAAEADMILPNLTEAAFLLGREYRESYTRREIQELLRDLAEMGPETVILTGVSCEDGKIGAAAYEKGEGIYTEYQAEKLGKSYHGTGDLFASNTIAALLNGTDMEQALRESCEFVAECIRGTVSDTAHFYGVHFERVLAEK